MSNAAVASDAVNARVSIATTDPKTPSGSLSRRGWGLRPLSGSRAGWRV